MAEESFPLYATAVIIPILALPACILCIPPMYWHFSQRNIAAGSLILWTTVFNFFNFINPLIWPRDNHEEWWDGNVLCDIEVHLQTCGVVALTACAGVIARKLARVMDTSNITVAPSRSDRNKEKILEILCCWGYPLILMSLYYIVQPNRYFIFAISGCVASYDTSWPSIVVSWMWGPLTTFVGAYYSGLLIFRLFRYRREFHRLISARNTTKSRFIRLFLMAKIFITVFLPYNICILYVQASTAKDPYDWNFVHGSNWNTIIKVPTHGEIRWDRWAQIASGYLLFLLFGTGLDAHNTYKRMFCAVGLGKIFPSLHVMRESSSATPSSVTFAKGFASSCASKAKSYFSKGDSSIDSLPGSTRSDSIYLDTPTKGRPVPFQHIPTNEPMLPPRSTHFANMSSTTRSVFNRMFGGGSHQSLVLPLFASKSVDQMSAVEKSPVESIPSGVHARAWAVDGSAAMRHGNGGVHVVHEVHQAHYNGNAAKKGTQVTDWA